MSNEAVPPSYVGQISAQIEEAARGAPFPPTDQDHCSPSGRAAKVSADTGPEPEPEPDTMALPRQDLEAIVADDFAARPALSPAEGEANCLAALHGHELPVCPVHREPACGCYRVACGPNDDITPARSTPRRRHKGRRKR